MDTARAFLQSENMKSVVMDLRIPLAMASSSLSKGGEELAVHTGDGSRETQDIELMWKYLETQDSSTRFPSTTDDEVNISMGTIDSETPNVGFPEQPVPSAGPAAACKRLVEMSVQRGCHDDISVLIVDLQHFRRQTGFGASQTNVLLG